MSNIYYLNSSANGTNDGTSLDNAWQSTSAINWTNISGGDIIYVAPGTGSYNTLTIAKGGISTGARITFCSLEWSGFARPVFTNISNSNGYDYIGIIGFEIASGSNAFDFGGNQSVNGWFISDGDIHDMSGGGIVWDNDATSNYNHVRNVSFQDLGVGSTTAGYNIILAGDYNIAEYISYGRGQDRNRAFGKYNIIRNCYAGPMLTGDLEGTDPHIDELQFWDQAAGGVNETSGIILFENYFAYKNELGNSHGMNVQDADDSSSVFGGLIWRNTIMAFHGSTPGAEFQSFDRTRVYNNLFIDGFQRSLPATWQATFWYRDNSNDHVNINNSYVRAAGNQKTFEFQNWVGTGFVGDYNHTFDQAGTLTGLNNITGNPLFTNESGKNYMPTISSPLVTNTPRWQTQANGTATNSTALVVDDAKYFTDGFGLVDADKIKIGSGNWVRISSIDYNSNTITLSEQRTWSDNDGVVLFGTEDFGPLEYRENGYALSASISNNGNNYTVSVNDENIVRMAIFYENGIPQEPVYDSPFTYTSNGGTVNAKVYPRFTSETLYATASSSSLMGDKMRLKNFRSFKGVKSVIKV